MDLPSMEDLDRLAGFAALVNGIILWPMVRAIKGTVEALRAEVSELKKPPRRKKK